MLPTTSSLLTFIIPTNSRNYTIIPKPRETSMTLWWGSVIRRKLLWSSKAPSSHHQDNNINSANIILLRTNNGVGFSQESLGSSSCRGYSVFLSREDIAAVTIQAYFRAHLARRAYRALRSLVRLQAVVRGVLVRRQARLALECMNALARLQITVRARQLLLNVN